MKKLVLYFLDDLVYYYGNNSCNELNLQKMGLEPAEIAQIKLFLGDDNDVAWDNAVVTIVRNYLKGL